VLTGVAPPTKPALVRDHLSVIVRPIDINDVLDGHVALEVQCAYGLMLTPSSIERECGHDNRSPAAVEELIVAVGLPPTADWPGHTEHPATFQVSRGFRVTFQVSRCFRVSWAFRISGGRSITKTWASECSKQAARTTHPYRTSPCGSPPPLGAAQDPERLSSAKVPRRSRQGSRRGIFSRPLDRTEQSAYTQPCVDLLNRRFSD
jgi:hypothetical protein